MSIRLINTKSLGMKTFAGEKMPPYAILSHTWVEDEEVDLQDMTRLIQEPGHPAKLRSGYQKIIQTCQLAASQGLDYAWIDTCCIDKSSSAELSESINSMFQWYQNSAVCFVFLEDMEVQADMNTHLARCKWFTRGWCLQELLAPAHIKFYNKDWGCIGIKSDLAQLLASITNIDEEVLADSSLRNTYAVARRMSWAAHRVTTRVEDLAYCLLGIFDVKMPMLYGEGTRAFLRLQEEIIKRSNDLSIFAFLDLPERSTADSADAGQSEVQEEDQYCDLFADCPRAFLHCHDLVRLGDAAISTKSFVLTNNGLYFKAADLSVGGPLGSYRMSLQCQRFQDPGLVSLHLQKVGPGLFARIRKPTGISSPNRFRRPYAFDVTEEIHIMTEMTNSIRKDIATSRRHVIEIRCDGLEEYADAIQFMHPRDRWDAAGLQFLTSGLSNIQGRFKFFPRFTYTAGDLQPFHVACGVFANRLEEPKSWVSLFTEDKWKYYGDRYGSMIDQMFPRDSIRLGETLDLNFGAQRVSATAYQDASNSTQRRIRLHVSCTVE